MRSILAVTLLLFSISVTAGEAGDKPSVGAKGMPGAAGTIEFKPKDWEEGEVTWWLDSDGIDPGEAGCHIGADSNGQPVHK